MERLLKLKEIKPTIIFYRDNTNQVEKTIDGYIRNNMEEQIRDIIESLANSLLRGIYPSIYLPFTDNILLIVYDKDTCFNEYQKETLENRLARDNDEMNQGRNTMLVSRSFFFALDTIIKKQNYLVDCIYESFLSYFNRFKIETKSLFHSYERLKKSDFYFITNNKHQYKKSDLFICIQIQKDLNVNRYRLVLTNSMTNETLEIHQLPNRDTFYNILDGINLIEASKNNKVPAYCFMVSGWKRDKFLFQFGNFGPTDYFEYDIKTKILREEINTNNPVDYELPKDKNDSLENSEYQRYLSEDNITIELEKEFMPSKQNIVEYFKSKNIKIEFVKNDKYLSPSNNPHSIQDEEILIEFGNPRGILMYLDGNDNTYNWKLMNFSDNPKIMELLVYDFLVGINFISIQSGTYFYSRSKLISDINSGDLDKILKKATLDKKAFQETIEEHNNYLSKDVVEIDFKKEYLPSTDDLKKFYKDKKINIEFITYWGDKLNSIDVKSNLNGVNIVKNGSSEGIQMELVQSLKNVLLKLMNFSDDPTLFNIFIYEFIISLNFEKISCGNMNFSKEEWEQFIISNEFLNISKISTIET